MGNKAYNPRLKNKWDKVSKMLTEEVMCDLIGAAKVTDNEHEDRGDFSQGFWDQQYELPGTGTRIYVESEMKDEKWWGPGYGLTGDGPFKYDTVDIPYRKAKNKAKLYMLFSTDGKYGFVVTRKVMDAVIAENGVKKKDTIYKSGEDFYSIPTSQGFFVEKSPDGRWRRWKRS